MGAKQSKRSVDISGKEAEGAGEVAAAGAGGEGRMEPLADADALKPQLNGDAHIHEQTDKEKELDSGTPENEKDATTEKEVKQQEEEKEAAPLTNGESEQKVENGESAPTPEDGKKPKKEKVKKKWSLRSISFSRKDKPKQEKKQKEEEPKTNGEPEKVPEETAEVAPEPAAAETAEEAKTPNEVKDEKTPETPVTEPITNGSTTPESPKVESPEVEEPAAPSPETDRPEPKAEPEPEQLPVNGLSLEEPAKETPEVEKSDESKEEPTTETTEIVPEISVKKEVCVEQMPLIDSTPPPLPANPPPSSVASFAATTMAPETTDASLANTADNAIPLPSDPKDKLEQPLTEPEKEIITTPTISNELPSPVKDSEEKPVIDDVETESNLPKKLENIHMEGNLPAPVEMIKSANEITEAPITEQIPEPALIESQIKEHAKIEENPVVEKVPTPVNISMIEKLSEPSPIESSEELSKSTPVQLAVTNESLEPTGIDASVSEELPEPTPAEALIENLLESLPENPVTEKETELVPVESVEAEPEITVAPIAETIKDDAFENTEVEMPSPPSEMIDVPEDKTDIPNSMEDLPPPPPICDNEDTLENNVVQEKLDNTPIPKIETDVVRNSNHVSSEETAPNEKDLVNENGLSVESKNKVINSVGSPKEKMECNGNIALEEQHSGAVPPAPSSAPPAAPSQEPLPVSDKLADLIPEVPDVPELKTETLQETTNDVAVAN